MYCVFSLFIKISRENDENPGIELCEDWTVYAGGEVYRNVDTRRFHLQEPLDRGDTLVMERQIPADLPKKAGLRIYTEMVKIDVYVGSDKVYSYGEKTYDDRKFIGGGFHFLTLPDDCGGKRLKIVEVATERVESDLLSPVVATWSATMYQTFMAGNMISVYFVFFTLVLGIALFFISLAFAPLNRSYFILMATGLFSFVISVWALCYAKVFEIFGMSIEANSYLEYLFIYLLPFPFLFLMNVTHEDLAPERRRILGLLGKAYLAFFLAALLFQQMNFMHFPRFIRIYHVLGLAIVVIAIVATYKPFRRQNAAERTFTVSLLILFAFCIAEVIRFNLQHTFVSMKAFQTTILPFGVVIFVAGTIAGYLISLFRHLKTKEEEQALEELGTIDAPTGLYNRKMANRAFDALDRAAGEAFTFVNFDLNGLKKTNDTYGHEQGDILIRTFADILRETFSALGDIYRMGGDEFLVIIHGKREGELTAALGRVTEKEREASESASFPVDAAFGVARSDEAAGGGADAVYRLSDARMYAMKKGSGKGRKEDV